MTNSNVSNVAAFIVRSTTGEIDINASVDNFHAELDAYVKKHRRELKKVAKAVNDVFDQHRGKAFSVSAIQSFTLQSMGVSPENYDEMSNLIREYIKSDPNFMVNRGRGGGVTRLSDLQAAAPSPVEDEDEEDEEDEGEELEAAPAPAPRTSRPAPRASTPAPRASSMPAPRTTQRPSARAAAR